MNRPPPHLLNFNTSTGCGISPGSPSSKFLETNANKSYLFWATDYTVLRTIEDCSLIPQLSSTWCSSDVSRLQFQLANHILYLRMQGPHLRRHELLSSPSKEKRYFSCFDLLDRKSTAITTTLLPATFCFQQVHFL